MYSNPGSSTNKWVIYFSRVLNKIRPASVLLKSISNRYWPDRTDVGPITVRCRFKQNADCVIHLPTRLFSHWYRCFLIFSNCIHWKVFFWRTQWLHSTITSITYDVKRHDTWRHNVIDVVHEEGRLDNQRSISPACTQRWNNVDSIWRCINVVSTLCGSVGCASVWWSGSRGFDLRRVRRHSFGEIDHEIFSSFWWMNVHKYWLTA